LARLHDRLDQSRAQEREIDETLYVSPGYAGGVDDGKFASKT
jgi:hypothetical protein